MYNICDTAEMGKTLGGYYTVLETLNEKYYVIL